MPRLVFSKDGQTLFQRSFSSASLLIGRDPTCDIQLFDPEISRRHCLLETQNGGFVLKDLSRNGTWLNRKKISHGRLKTNDQIQVGRWCLSFLEEPAASIPETVHSLPPAAASPAGLGSMLGGSGTMRKVFAKIRQAAGSDLTVCLIGESGTGKELAARLIHDFSNRHDRPFVALNCGAIPNNLIESLLFGHERGSFTGATERQLGVFEQANGGTLFLDEIGEMPVELQTRLLRVLEEKKVRRIGGKSEVAVDVRLIAATLRDLQTQVSAASFRADLFYRLYVFPIELPSLRQRKSDLALLARHFLAAACPGRSSALSESVLEKLRGYDWPGNVRELRNVLQRAALLAGKKEIGTEHIAFTPVTAAAAAGSDMNLADQEKSSILEALRKTGGNRARAAKLLGVARTTVNSKLRRYKLNV